MGFGNMVFWRLDLLIHIYCVPIQRLDLLIHIYCVPIQRLDLLIHIYRVPIQQHTFKHNIYRQPRGVVWDFSTVWLLMISVFSEKKISRLKVSVHQLKTQSDWWMGPLPVLGQWKSSMKESESVRLVDGAGLCSGRVEVKSNQSWASVCEADFDRQDAEVVCGELGCGAPAALQGGLYGEGEGQTWDKEFQCKGKESFLLVCDTSDEKHNTCLPGNAVGLTCSEPDDVRLVGGSSRCAGGVEWYDQGEWRTVGADGDQEAVGAVVCRQLGCGSTVSVPPGDTTRGVEVICSGSESSLRECWRSSYLLPGLTVICSDDSHQGNYSCVYETDVFSHSFSSESELLSLTITASPLPAFIIRHVVVLLILLTSITTSYLYYKPTRRQKRVNRVSSMDLYVNAMETVSLSSRAEAGPGEERPAQGTE
ncbi:scavenger receptor cysteine-rich type 1 protein M130-like [Oncorhynchus clarkii lewisi]|uniref:scavenger receptor cysteine-rich type 1 protein M130-like n=1 Tax=Oncorhynchus clarkii lewisi TaxID=490388 RepID=UPI0039B91F2A